MSERYHVKLRRSSGHWQGERYPAGTPMTAVYNVRRELWDVTMPDGHIIGHTSADVIVIAPVPS